MPKSTTTAYDTLDAFLRAVDPSWRAGATRYIALHTADPANAGTQTTSEATYTGYARVAVTAATGFSAASAGASQNTGLIQFPQCTGGTNVITHVSIGTATTGAGQIIYRGALNASLSVANLIQPQFSIGSLTASES
mgnify:FL=1